MKRRTIHDYNNFLESINSLLRVIVIKKDYILFNNGVELTTIDKVRNFRIRLKNPSVELLDRIDIIYGTDAVASAAAISELKSIQCSRAGKLSWEKSGDSIKQKMKGRTPYNKGKSGIYKLGSPSVEHRAKISAANSGHNNGMYGRSMSDEQKEHKSILMKTKILTGEFTPCSNNRNTHWNTVYNNERFRSSWEALYKYNNPNALYENLRLEYELNDKNKIYIVDFIDNVSRIVAEVKPKELCKGEEFEAKLKSLKEWAMVNEYQVIIVDQDWLINVNEPSDYSLFDAESIKKIKKFYEINKKNRDR